MVQKKASIIGATLRFRTFVYALEVARDSMNLWEDIVAKGFELGLTVAARIVETLSIKMGVEKSQGIAQLSAVAIGTVYVRVTMAPDSKAATVRCEEKALCICVRTSVASRPVACLLSEATQT